MFEKLFSIFLDFLWLKHYFAILFDRFLLFLGNFYAFKEYYFKTRKPGFSRVFSLQNPKTRVSENRPELETLLYT